MSAVVVDLSAWRRDHPRRAARDLPSNPTQPLLTELVRLQGALWCAPWAAFWAAWASVFSRGGKP